MFVSATTGIDPSTGELAGNTIPVQTRQALLNCDAILQAAGANLARWRHCRVGSVRRSGSLPAATIFRSCNGWHETIPAASAQHGKSSAALDVVASPGAAPAQQLERMPNRW